MLSFLSSLKKHADNFLGYCLGDNYKIIVHQENFILGELTQRAINSPSGLAYTHLGFSFLAIRTFVVGTNKENVTQIAEYGDYRKNDREHFDPHSRLFFQSFEQLFGIKPIISKNDESVAKERSVIKKYLDSSSTLNNTQNYTNACFDNWDETNSFSEKISLIVCQIIGKTWYGMDYVNADVVPKLKKLQKALLKINTFSSSKIQEISNELENYNRDMREQNKESICSGDNYLTHSIKNKTLTFDQVKPLFGLVVEDNLSAALIIGALCVAANNCIKKNMLKQLQKLDSTHENFSDALKKEPILNTIYLESLRLAAPSFPIVRYASKAVTIGEHQFPPRTILFVPLRAISLAKKHWDKPDEFYPDQQKRYKKLCFPNSTLSMGSRMCPAGSVFTEVVFKAFMYTLFMKYDLKFKQKFTLRSHLHESKLQFAHPIKVDITAKQKPSGMPVSEDPGLYYNYASPRSARKKLTPTFKRKKPSTLKRSSLRKSKKI